MFSWRRDRRKTRHSRRFVIDVGRHFGGAASFEPRCREGSVRFLTEDYFFPRTGTIHAAIRHKHAHMRERRRRQAEKKGSKPDHDSSPASQACALTTTRSIRRTYTVVVHLVRSETAPANSRPGSAVGRSELEVPTRKAEARPSPLSVSEGEILPQPHGMWRA